MGYWFNNAIIYHLHPLGFLSPQQGSNDEKSVYSLNKISSLIPRMKELNADALYLGPVFESGSCGLDTKDFMKIDSRIGDNNSFRKLCHELHSNSVRIVLEIVFNRVGRDFFAFQDVKEKKSSSAYCGWFQNLNFGAESPYGDDFWYEGFNDRFDLVKLNMRNPQVIEYISRVINFWIDEFDIDGIAFDCADCLDFDFFKRINRLCKSKKPDLWLMGKLAHGDYKRWANPEMLDSIANYECCRSLTAAFNSSCYEIDFAINRQSGPNGIYKGMHLYNFIQSSSTLHNIRNLSILYTLLYTMPGIPSVYYPDESCTQQSQHNDIYHSSTPSDAGNETIPDNSKQLHDHLIRLGKIYRAYPELRTGDYATVMTRNKQFVFSKTQNGQVSYVILNTGDLSCEITIETTLKDLADILGDLPLRYTDSTVSVTLPPHTSAVISRISELDACDAEITAESNKTDVVPGELYKHYKGNIYRVLCVAKHTETMEELVVYQSQSDESKIWARPKTIFTDTVDGIKRFSIIQ
ncbi:MAG: DUF1653 domain-containing protein [Oscillospiraceae bacterium]|nr:DUF1653 domain-containing protein [Oscillospiraceae bacterium]